MEIYFSLFCFQNQDDYTMARTWEWFMPRIKKDKWNTLQYESMILEELSSHHSFIASQNESPII